MYMGSSPHQYHPNVEPLEDRNLLSSSSAIPSLPLPEHSQQVLIGEMVRQQPRIDMSAAQALQIPPMNDVSRAALDRVFAEDYRVEIPTLPKAPLSSKVKRRDVVDYISGMADLRAFLARGASPQDIEYADALRKFLGGRAISELDSEISWETYPR